MFDSWLGPAFDHRGFDYPSRFLTPETLSYLSEEDKESLLSGQAYPVETTYGKGYFTWDYLEESRQYEFDLSEKMPVSSFPVLEAVKTIPNGYLELFSGKMSGQNLACLRRRRVELEWQRENARNVPIRGRGPDFAQARQSPPDEVT